MQKRIPILYIVVDAASIGERARAKNLRFLSRSNVRTRVIWQYLQPARIYLSRFISVKYIYIYVYTLALRNLTLPQGVEYYICSLYIYSCTWWREPIDARVYADNACFRSLIVWIYSTIIHSRKPYIYTLDTIIIVNRDQILNIQIWLQRERSFWNATFSFYCFFRTDCFSKLYTMQNFISIQPFFICRVQLTFHIGILHFIKFVSFLGQSTVPAVHPIKRANSIPTPSWSFFFTRIAARVELAEMQILTKSRVVVATESMQCTLPSMQPTRHSTHTDTQTLLVYCTLTLSTRSLFSLSLYAVVYL